MFRKTLWLRNFPFRLYVLPYCFNYLLLYEDLPVERRTLAGLCVFRISESISYSYKSSSSLLFCNKTHNLFQSRHRGNN